MAGSARKLLKHFIIHIPHFLLRRKILFISLIILTIILPITYLTLKHSSKTEAAWFNDNWLYRKSIQVTNNTSTQSNVYIAVTIDTSDTSKFQDDCGDLRFTKYNGQLLDYYIVSGCGTTSTSIHVNFDTFPAGTQTIYYYYGNPSAENGFSASDFSTQASDYTIGTVGSEEKSPGPVAYWKFDEGYGTTAHDSTRNGNNGTINGATWKPESECVSGKCLYFRGTTSTDKVDVTLNDYSKLTKSITISFWYKATNDDNSWDGILNINGGYGSGTRFLVRKDYSNNQIDWQANYGDANPRVVSTGTLTLNEWHFITATYDGQTATLYADGKYVTSYSETRDLTLNSALQIGYAQYYFQGYLDEVKIYPYARSAAQIKADYNARGAVKGVSAQIGANNQRQSALSNGLVGYWKMDESSWNGTSGEVIDSSGNGNNGTAQNGATTAAGKFGNAGSFDGSDDYVSIPDNDNLDLIDELTLAAWIKLNNTSSAHRIFKKGNPYNYGGVGYSLLYRGDYTNKAFQLQLNDGSDACTSPSVNVGDIGTNWNHIVVTINKTNHTIKFYLNGELKSTQTLSCLGSFNTTSPLEAPSSTTAYHGSIDEVRIYNRALSPREVRALYNWAPGPVLHLKMDEKSGTTAYDTSGNGNNGTLTNGPIWTQGKFGGALSFDGNDDYISISDTTNSVLDITNQITIEMWLYTKDYPPSAYANILRKEPAYLITNTTDGKVNMLLYDGSTWHSITGNTALTKNKWIHITGTFDGTNWKLYLNGLLDSTQTDSMVINTNNNSLGVGNHVIPGQWNTFGFNGIIDDVRIYNYARTQKQIIEDMNAGHPIGGSPVGSQIGYWKFDEGYGTTVHDSSPQGNNGTISGATWTNNGKFGKALSFDGSGDYVNLGNVMSTGGSFTYSLWVKYNGQSSASQWPYLLGPTNTHVYPGIRGGGNYGSNPPYLEWGNNAPTCDGSSYTSLSVPSETDGNWHYIAFTYDGSVVKAYFDGKYYTQKSASSMCSGNPSFQVGEYYNGLIDEVKIYNSALTEDEIKLDYNQGKSLVLGSISTDSDGSTASNADAREYCVPGDTSYCAPPVAEWKFDEKTGTTAYDTSGNGNNGTINGATWKGSAECKTGACLSFDGSDDYVNSPAISSISGTNPRSVSLWFKTTLDRNQPLYDSGATSTNDTAFQIFQSNTIGGTGAPSNQKGLYVAFWANDILINKNVYDGNWHHVEVTLSGTTLRIKIDGEYPDGYIWDGSSWSGLTSQPFTLPRQPNTTNNSVWIGHSRSTLWGYGYTYFDGLIDQVRIYNYARTPAQIAWDYNRGKPVGWWRFDECQGTTAYDASGNGNNGTITIGGSGSQTSVGTCTDGLSTSAWYNGATGKYNSSLNFDGTDDYVNFGSNSIFNFGTNDFSIVYWFKTSGDSDTYEYFIRHMSGKGYQTYINPSNRMVMHVYDGTDEIYPNTGISVTDNQWHQFAGVADRDGYLKVYLDGVLKSRNSMSSIDDISVSTNLMAGTSSSNTINGQIDDVRIYNYALTPLQVKQLYNEGAAVRFAPLEGSP